MNPLKVIFVLDGAKPVAVFLSWDEAHQFMARLERAGVNWFRTEERETQDGSKADG